MEMIEESALQPLKADKIQLLDRGIIYRKPRPYLHSRHAHFRGERGAGFDIGSAFEAVDVRTYFSRSVDQGRELTIVFLMNNKVSSLLDFSIETYLYPVEVNLLNHEKWTDVVAEQTDAGLVLKNIQASFEPKIIRLFSKGIFPAAVEVSP
jgi:hypothetical protein